jgi:hypothetical protein
MNSIILAGNVDAVQGLAGKAELVKFCIAKMWTR